MITCDFFLLFSLINDVDEEDGRKQVPPQDSRE